MAWADQLEAHSTTINASKGPKSTLAKRGTKDRSAEGDSGTGNAPKKVKVEGGSSEDELRQHFEKGTLSKVVSHLSLRWLCFQLLTECSSPFPSSKNSLLLAAAQRQGRRRISWSGWRSSLRQNELALWPFPLSIWYLLLEGLD